VYVSGLPEDITLEEFKEFMTKVGVVAFDPVYRKPKLKLYTNPDGAFKGDGRCCYIKVWRMSCVLVILWFHIVILINECALCSTTHFPMSLR